MALRRAGRLLVTVVAGLILALGNRMTAATSASADEARPLMQLRAAVASGARIRIDSIPLVAGMPATLELVRFEVFTPDAVIAVHGDDGERLEAPPKSQYFRGNVAGDERSHVFLVVDEDVRGFIVTEGRTYAVGTEPDAARIPRRTLTVREFDPESEFPVRAAMFRCESEGISKPGSGLQKLSRKETAAYVTTPITYNVRIALETDYEFFQMFGTSAALTSYVGSLAGASSAIYYRDVRTTLQISYLSIWTTSSDPWSATSPSAALYEFGDYWHANRTGVSRTTAHFLSGKSLGGGVAWLGVLCYGDFLCSGGNCGSSSANGHYGGGYGVSGSLSGQFSTSNPGLYWDILCVSHEIGHNFSSPHTHCYSPPVDQCYASESGCYSGPTSVPTEKGTIMSYCHVLSGGNSNIKLYLGVPGEPSQAVTDKVRSYVQAVASCLNVPTPGRGDFNGDTWPDILWRNGATGQNALWLMSGTSFGSVADLPALPNTNYVIGGAADFNADGKPDIVWRNTSTGQNALWLMNGTALQAITDLPALPNTNYVISGTGDFNGDGNPDIVWRNNVTGQNAVWLMNGTSLQAIVDLPALPNTSYVIAGIGEFDGGSNPDIVWRNTATGQIAVWLMNGTSLQAIVDLPALPNPNYRVGAIADYDGDGKADIVWRNMATGQNAVWLMNGTSVKGIVEFPPLSNTSYQMAGPK